MKSWVNFVLEFKFMWLWLLLLWTTNRFMGRLGNLPGTSFNQVSRKEDLCVVWVSRTSLVSPYLRTNLSILTLNSSEWGKICKKLSKKQQHPYFGEVGALKDTVSRKSFARTLLHLLLCTAVGVACSLCTVNSANMPRSGLACFLGFLQTPQHFRHSTGEKWGVQIPSLELFPLWNSRASTPFPEFPELPMESLCTGLSFVQPSLHTSYSDTTQLWSYTA